MTDPFVPHLEPAEPHREPDWSKPSVALLACSGTKHGVVLYYHGPHIDFEIDGVGLSGAFESMGGHYQDGGLWVWEGTMHTSVSYEGEHDTELVGSLRAPTAEEWEHIDDGDDPWEEDDWWCEPGQCCRRDHDHDGNCDKHPRNP